jgi:hypothetical protein
MLKRGSDNEVTMNSAHDESKLHDGDGYNDESEGSESTPARELDPEYIQSRAKQFRKFLDEAAGRKSAYTIPAEPPPLPASLLTAIQPKSAVKGGQFYIHTTWGKARYWGYNKGPFSEEEVRHQLANKAIGWSDMISETVINPKDTYRAPWRELYTDQIFSPYAYLHDRLEDKPTYERLFQEKYMEDPSSWARHYIGNADIVEKLVSLISVSKATNTLLPNILLSGPKQCGKSLLLGAIINDLSDNRKAWTADSCFCCLASGESPTIEADIIGVENLELKATGVSWLGKTVIATTSNSASCLDDFPIHFRLHPYTSENITSILQLENKETKEDVLALIADKAVGSLRHARSLFKWCLHYAGYKGIDMLDPETVIEGLSLTQ